MGNCLVTKLKENVDNNNLLKIGEIRIKIANGTLHLNTLSSNYIKGVNGVKINGEDTLNINAGFGDYIISGLDNDTIGEIIIGNKYVINDISGCMVINGLSDFKYSDIHQFGVYDFSGNYIDSIININEFAECMPNVTSILIGGDKISGDVESLVPLKDSIESLSFYASTYDSPVSGDFAALGHLYKLSTLGTVMFKCTGIAGSIESFVAARLEEQPNTAGSVISVLLGYFGGITYQGQTIAIKQNNTIAWDAAGNITFTQSD